MPGTETAHSRSTTRHRFADRFGATMAVVLLAAASPCGSNPLFLCQAPYLLHIEYALPNAIALAGMQIHQQVLALELSTSGLVEATATQAVTLTLGTL